MSGDAIPVSPRPPWYRDVRVLRVLGQIAFAVATVWVVWTLWTNLLINMGNANLPTGFDYLRQPGGIQVAGADATSSTPIWQLFVIGAKNTAIVSAIGVVFATVIGVLVGIARLSTNWLVRKSAALYVEAFRNIPVLVVIAFFASALILRFPRIQDPFELGGVVIASNRGVWFPWPATVEGASAGVFWLLVAASAVAAVAVARWRTRHNERTGEPHHRVAWALGTFAVLAGAAYVVLGTPVELSLPERDGLRVTGGIGMLAPILGLTAGLTVYTASHIAEIVRGSILAIPKGQNEAAQAIALSGFQRMRFVVLPQATRIMIPPLANQYLNLTKNSSLGLFVGAAELTSITTTIIANGRPAPQNIGILMAIYLAFSLFISLLTNLYNRRIQYVTS